MSDYKEIISEYNNKRKQLIEEYQNEQVEKINSYIDKMLSNLPNKLEKSLNYATKGKFILYAFSDTHRDELSCEQGVKDLIETEKDFAKDIDLTHEQRTEVILRKLRSLNLEDVYLENKAQYYYIYISENRLL